MRLRHTSRTDTKMAGERRQVSFRLDSWHRDRMKEIVEAGVVPDIRTESDLMQDAVWLWMYEYDREMGSDKPRRGPRPDLRADSIHPPQEEEELQVGSAAQED